MIRVGKRRWRNKKKELEGKGWKSSQRHIQHSSIIPQFSPHTERAFCNKQNTNNLLFGPWSDLCNSPPPPLITCISPIFFLTKNFSFVKKTIVIQKKKKISRWPYMLLFSYGFLIYAQFKPRCIWLHMGWVEPPRMTILAVGEGCILAVTTDPNNHTPVGWWRNSRVLVSFWVLNIMVFRRTSGSCLVQLKQIWRMRVLILA